MITISISFTIICFFFSFLCPSKCVRKVFVELKYFSREMKTRCSNPKTKMEIVEMYSSSNNGQPNDLTITLKIFLLRIEQKFPKKTPRFEKKVLRASSKFAWGFLGQNNMARTYALLGLSKNLLFSSIFEKKTRFSLKKNHNSAPFQLNLAAYQFSA